MDRKWVNTEDKVGREGSESHSIVLGLRWFMVLREWERLRESAEPKLHTLLCFCLSI